jgi:hypothetical protein
MGVIRVLTVRVVVVVVVVVVQQQKPSGYNILVPPCGHLRVVRPMHRGLTQTEEVGLLEQAVESRVEGDMEIQSGHSVAVLLVQQVLT